MIAREDEHRYAGRRKLVTGRLILGGVTVVGNVAGHQDRVDRQTPQVVHDPPRSSESPRSEVEMDITDMREDKHPLVIPDAPAGAARRPVAVTPTWATTPDEPSLDRFSGVLVALIP
jgi:hypothetical protein